MAPAWNAALLVAAGLCAAWLVGLVVFRGPEWLRILALAVGAAIGYGSAHDLVTARISIEYFTIGHPRLFVTDDPVPHALAWGVLATWWVGALLGSALALAARRGTRPKVAARELVQPIAVLLCAMALCAVLAALVGRAGAQRGWFVIYGDLAQRVPAEKHVSFLTAGFAHGASYLVGFAGGGLLVARTWRRRARV
ncbi:MAG: hypothetical protein IPJ19_11545 [Planctomycetes bacterium]|nr:hypothetical protein [Planctomycetota bacterium]